jgi:hypothetical protein
MKIEVGSFTLNSNPYTFYFDDATLQAKAIVFVSGKDSSTGTNLSIGISDGANERCISTLYDTSKKTDFATQAVLHYLNVSGTPTVKLNATGVDLSVAGECTIGTVSNYDATIPIMYIVIGE